MADDTQESKEEISARVYQFLFDAMLDFKRIECYAFTHDTLALKPMDTFLQGFGYGKLCQHSIPDADFDRLYAEADKQSSDKLDIFDEIDKDHAEDMLSRFTMFDLSYDHHAAARQAAQRHWIENRHLAYAAAGVPMP